MSGKASPPDVEGVGGTHEEDLLAGARAPLTIRTLLQRKRASLILELLTGEEVLGREVRDPDLPSPGLALAGYTQRFPDGRMQVFGETEMTYLRSLDGDDAREKLGSLFSFDIPACFVTKGQEVPDYFLEEALRKEVPVLRSALSTKDFYHRIKPFLEAALAPSTTVHASMADIYGVGLLFVGRSGIGKSECVLDLVERGHRLVADDVVFVSRRGHDVLIGRGHELQQHHMEIRGIGIVDVRALFGIRAVRQQKRIEVVVQLEEWDTSREYNRTGLDKDETEILGVSLPQVTVPLNPGKNITVIAEVVAMNHLLKYAGVDSAALFHRRITESMQPVREYLEEDFE